MYPPAICLNLQNRRQKTGEGPIEPVSGGIASFDWLIQGGKCGTMASSATDGSSNVSVPTKNRLPAMPCASAECAEAKSANVSMELRIDPLRTAVPSRRRQD